MSRSLQEVFSNAEAMLFCQNTRKTGNNAGEMCQVFHDITRFENFTDLNLFKYMFSVIQKWATDALQFYSMRLIFLLAVMVEGYESTGLSLRAGGWGFSPATKRVAPSYFNWKIEEK